MSVEKIRKTVEAARDNARQIGEVVLMIAEADRHAAEVIAADLDNPKMSFDKCFGALYEYAKKHQKNNSWCCVCNRFDPDNPVIQVVAEFYKVNLSEAQREGALGHKVNLSEAPETQTLGQKKQQADELDLMSLL